MTRRASLQSARFGSSRHATHALLLAMLSVVTPGLAGGQALPMRQETASPSSTPVHEGPRNNPSASIQLAPLDQVPTSRCRLRVPDATPEFPAKGEPATPGAVPGLSPLCPLVASSISF